MSLAGGQGGHLRFQLTLFQQEGGGADYANRITACPSGFENLAASLNEVPVSCSVGYKTGVFSYFVYL